MNRRGFLATIAAALGWRKAEASIYPAERPSALPAPWEMRQMRVNSMNKGKFLYRPPGSRQWYIVSKIPYQDGAGGSVIVRYRRNL